MQVWTLSMEVRVALLLLLLTSTNVRAPPPPPSEQGEETPAGSRGGRHRRRAFPGPYFHPSSPVNVTTQLGAHAYLPCRIKNLGNKSVSWIRNRDSHILTVDRYTFISDERFSAWHEAQTQTWTLQVRYVQERDAGKYECQVSTEPKMSHFVDLSVITPTVSITGKSDIYVKSGSTVNIQCVITDALEEPTYIFWYHGNRRVVGTNSDSYQLTVHRKPPDTSIGTLTIASVSMADSGNYTCAPASLEMASVMLHVVIGEHPQAMHGTNSAAASTTGSATSSVSSSSSRSSAHTHGRHAMLGVWLATLMLLAVT
ncbi:zwei Ig domain protein zig-8-like [Portunus trituberculatus]|uniref:zwei Ig domain protein zig-8-like n=1 Tax=Portunus trituberculatus TaxID=210409 RepID=UPI001E1CE4A3|nr:zwei Ig domain protein zig-8-like [Portunus trituberculatus]XP_045133841.1 zwei Ig domain protein zig-8-like [Portunus trituberculatus]XP_045133842.1 zwei Ig domain protein zig-8-like [Portunus trituberculatus]XP_045133843.1 zwei Ig domain protein zig-8-like [Portunus trituberculatus]XP_045133844.1 zwei Ig domain protein zig-8-like [Portunus trituberculatus]XP_045133845.1 zwei Ig domain protein zig-8-like [Portunus trituberculatus]XP_045133847.1 zwei Ig domain protein zig-8-like [Portunus 